VLEVIRIGVGFFIGVGFAELPTPAAQGLALFLMIAAMGLGVAAKEWWRENGW
jgi:hypothetical protein